MNIVDIILIALIVLFVLWGWRRGLLSSIFGILKYAVGVPAALYVSEHYYKSVYQQFVYDKALEKVNERIDGALNLDTFVSSVETSLDKLPEFFRERIDVSVLQNAADSKAVAELIMQDFVQPAAYVLIKFVLFIITFIIIALICSLISATLKAKKDKHTVLTKANSAFGGVLGLIKSLLLISLISAAWQYLSVNGMVPADDKIVKAMDTSVIIDFVGNLLPFEFKI